MNLDVRLPIGLMFTMFGVILTGYGLVADSAIYRPSLGINVNLWWGLVLLGFGVVMFAFAMRARTARHDARDAASRPPSAGH